MAVAGKTTVTGVERTRSQPFDALAGRFVLYEYTKVESPLSRFGHEHLLTKITQPGKKVYQHTYHPVMGTSRFVLLDTLLNGVLQEKIAACDESAGVLKEVTHLLGATMSFERIADPDSSLKLLFLGAKPLERLLGTVGVTRCHS